MVSGLCLSRNRVLVETREWAVRWVCRREFVITTRIVIGEIDRTISSVLNMFSGHQLVSVENNGERWPTIYPDCGFRRWRSTPDRSKGDWKMAKNRDGSTYVPTMDRKRQPFGSPKYPAIPAQIARLGSRISVFRMFLSTEENLTNESTRGVVRNWN